MNSLHEFTDEQVTIEKEAFTVKNDSAANWALRKISEAEIKINEHDEFATNELEKEKAKIERWRESVNAEHLNTIDFMRGLLAEYAMKKKEEDPKFKSLKLPNGRIGFRKQQPQWIYDDEKVVQALKDSNLNDFINVKVSPKKADIKKAFDLRDGKVVNPDTGEILEGVTVTDQPDSFNVAVEK